MAEAVCAYLTASRVFATSTSDPRSSFRIDGGLARVKPVPVTSQPALSKTFTTCLPSRPVAPVMRAFFAILMVRGVVLVDGELCKWKSNMSKWSKISDFLHRVTPWPNTRLIYIYACSLGRKGTTSRECTGRKDINIVMGLLILIIPKPET